MGSNYRYKPSKPVAVIQILIGIAMIVLAVTTFAKHGFNAFFVVWIAVIVTGCRAGKPRTSMATVASNNGAG